MQSWFDNLERSRSEFEIHLDKSCFHMQWMTSNSGSNSSIILTASISSLICIINRISDIYDISRHILCNLSSRSTKSTLIFLFVWPSCVTQHGLCKFLQELPRALFLLMFHPDISTMFHPMTFCTRFLHRGSSPGLNFTGFSYLYQMSPRDTPGVG